MRLRDELSFIRPRLNEPIQHLSVLSVHYSYFVHGVRGEQLPRDGTLAA